MRIPCPDPAFEAPCSAAEPAPVEGPTPAGGPRFPEKTKGHVEFRTTHRGIIAGGLCALLAESSALGAEQAHPRRPATEPEPAAATGAQSATVSSTEAAPKRTESHRLVWGGRSLTWVDYAAIGALGAAYLAVETQLALPTEPQWSRPILFDGGLRSLVVAHSPESRARAATWSDVFWYAPNVWLWGETLAIPAADAMNYEITWRMAVINFQSYAVTGLISRAGHKLVGRERPDLEPCHEDAAYSEQCYSGELSSFPSGHTSGSFVGAGLLCAHHLGLGLYGNRHADAAACGVALAMGGATGILRMRADRHYASDVLTGAMIGFGAGFVLPWFLHYQWPEKVPAATRLVPLRWAVVPWAQEDSFGAATYGWF